MPRELWLQETRRYAQLSEEKFKILYSPSHYIKNAVELGTYRLADLSKTYKRRSQSILPKWRSRWARIWSLMPSIFWIRYQSFHFWKFSSWTVRLRGYTKAQLRGVSHFFISTTTSAVNTARLSAERAKKKRSWAASDAARYFIAYLQVAKFLLEKHATDEVTAENEFETPRLAQQSGKTPSHNAE